MKTSSAPHPGITKVLRNLTVVIAASFLAGLMASWARPTQVPPTKIMPAAQSAEEARLVEAWRISMAQTPLPKKGAFEATYPSKEWPRFRAQGAALSIPTSVRAKTLHRRRRERCLSPGAHWTHILGDRLFCQRQCDEREWPE